MAGSMIFFIKRVLILFYIFIITPVLYADNIDLFILAGQSNMQGWRSDAKQYPADKKQLDSRIPFYYETIGYDSSQKQWGILKPQLGHFQSGHFGPEITFGRALLKTGHVPAIFKYSLGGSSLKLDWKAPGQQGIYDNMVSSIKTAIQTLKAQGHAVTPRAIIWIQGESDADSVQLSTEYYWHLKKMLKHLRNSVIRHPSTPVILSVDEQHPRVQQNPQVVDAQIQLAMEDPTISFVSMHGLEKYDVTHLTAKGTIEQGNRIFQAYQQLQK